MVLAVDGVNVGPRCNQQLDHLQVALEGGGMQGRTFRARVDKTWKGRICFFSRS